jgi:UDP-galactopyranose mutase
MTRFAAQYRVIFIEEPVYHGDGAGYNATAIPTNIIRVVPHLPEGLSPDESTAEMKHLLRRIFRELQIESYFFWYYTPMALAISEDYNPLMIIYDCMDELSAFKFAPQELKDREKELMAKADIVFTGGHSLYESKKHLHHNIHAFPSSIDVEHFYKARYYTEDPDDQLHIPHPRIGFYGVIDERMDIALIDTVARRKPEWHFILIGPVVKIDENDLPRLPNIHYLNKKEYQDLPSYISGWDIAMLPFAHNESTRFISPTKTPEYLAAGKPVISTPIIDVIRHYGANKLVHIAGTADEFIRVAALELGTRDRKEWLAQVNDLLSKNSWDKTWQQMMHLMEVQLTSKINPIITKPRENAYV